MDNIDRSFLEHEQRSLDGLGPKALRNLRASAPAARTLVATDNGLMRNTVVSVLAGAGYQVELLSSLALVEAATVRSTPELVILAVEHIEGSELEYCRFLRMQSNIPIVLISAHASAEQRVQGLRSGADVYLSAPYEPAELLARVKALLRRQRSALVRPSPRITLGALTLDLTAQQIAFAHGAAVRLTPTEVRLLHLLMQHANRLLSAEAICCAIWQAHTPDIRLRLHVHISRLRKKIEPHAQLSALPNQGYQLNTESTSRLLS